MKHLKLVTNNVSNDKAIKILARSMYRELVNNGFSNLDIINFSREIIDNLRISSESTLELKQKVS